MDNFRKLAEKIGINVQGGTVNVGEIRLDSEMSRQEYRNRLALLNLVKTAWVEGVLEKSLHEQIPIVLGLEKHESAVDSPWNLNFIKADQAPEPLPAGTPVIDVFDKLGAGGTLLILGEPGSGKTITLLQLARDFIKRAEDDGSCRIPVVLNLSSWAAKKQTIAQWIVEELNSNYQVNRKIGQQWVEKQELLLLLDGLDEIRDLENCKACVIALNTFQQEQSTEMVVCCRMRDYEKLGNKLRLKSALAIQPLTPNQFQDYLNRLELDLTALKTLLAEDKTLEELAQSPLLLNIMVLAYQGIEFANTSANTINSNRKKQLFDNYINRIFQGSRLTAYHPNFQSIDKQLYFRQDATRWLIWLAQQMVKYPMYKFSVKELDRYDCSLICMPLFLITMSLFELSFGLILGLNFGLILGLILGVYSGSVLGIFVGDIEDVIIDVAAIIVLIIIPIITTLLIIGVITGITIGLMTELTIGITIGIIAVLTAIYIVGTYSFNKYFEYLEDLLLDFNIYNEGSLLLGTFVALFFGLGFGLISGLNSGLSFGLISRLNSGLSFGLSFGLISGIMSTVLMSIIRRSILFFTGYIPWNYARFLDWASDKLFLQKVGGGYIFIHRSLMEHFAEMDTNSSTRDI